MMIVIVGAVLMAWFGTVLLAYGFGYRTGYRVMSKRAAPSEPTWYAGQCHACQTESRGPSPLACGRCSKVLYIKPLRAYPPFPDEAISTAPPPPPPEDTDPGRRIKEGGWPPKK